VDDVSFALAPRETLALVGESGCGKSVTALSIMGLVPAPQGRIAGGRIVLEERNLVGLPEATLETLRGNRVAMIFQEPMTSLNPVMTIGAQVAEGLMVHKGLSRRAADAKALAALEEVKIPSAATRFHDYPHQFSGGMRQRVMIAIALACEPAVLLADEPTTALDVTIQAQVLGLLADLKDRHGMAMLFITHNLGVVAQIADRVAVMYAGQIVEESRTNDLFTAPAHPYTRGLLASVPRITGTLRRLSPIPGTVPPPTQWPPACRFEPRCGERFERCAVERPTLLTAGTEHTGRCWLLEERR
jgi:oligopeptide/dipeptide ABC transporter ATP-binding protein